MANADKAEQTADVKTPDLGKLGEVLTNLTATASTKSAFGEPVTTAGRTVIPVADVLAAAGFGTGQAFGRPGEGSGSGGAGGGMARSRPLGTVVVDDQGVRILPIVDISRLALAGMATGGFLLVWMARLLRGDGVSATATAKSLPTPRAMRRLVNRVG